MQSVELWAVWVTAGASVLAALVPAFLFLLERADRKRAEEALAAERRDRQRSDERRAREAELAEVRKVVGWLELRHVGKPWVSVGGHVHYPAEKLFGVVLNASDSPVFAVRVHGRRSGADDEAPEVTEELDAPEWVELASWPVLPPRSTREIEMPSAAFLPAVLVEYEDAAGKRWSRHSSGAVAGENGRPRGEAKAVAGASTPAEAV